jgi:LPPG:FO 2-phospho-L-lactate transferase
MGHSDLGGQRVGAHGGGGPLKRPHGNISVLAGGVGAARMLKGLVRVVDEANVTVIVNTGDDTVLHGLAISPDLDTITYTLAGAANLETGWGLAGETWAAMEALGRYGDEAWFRLGDRDLGTHLFRTGRLAKGATLSEVTAEIAGAWGLSARLLPMSNDPVRTRVQLVEGPEIEFQEYFVRLRHSVPVADVRFEGADRATPAPGVLEALADAEAVLIAPSNPIVSIGPILAIEAIAAAVASRRDATVAISPIVAGQALKGPADRLLIELGEEASVVGVARRLVPYAATLVIDRADAVLSDEVEAVGMRCVVAETVMRTPEIAAELCEVALAASVEARTAKGADGR